MDVTACNDSSGAKAPAPVSKPSDGAGAQQSASSPAKTTLEESVISACPEPATKKRSTGSATDNGSEAATLAAKKQKLVRCGSSVADLLAKTQEVESLGKNAISDEQQCQTNDNRAADSVSVTPMRNIVDVEGYKTEVYRIPHDKPGKPEICIVIIPGNPGNAAYYLPLMANLHVLFEGRAEVMAISHKGHGINTACEQGFSLKEQIQHKVAFLEKECIAENSPPVALVGHSIGAYIALHATKAIETASDAAANAKEAVDAAAPPPSDVPGSSSNDNVPCPLSSDAKAEDAADPAEGKTCSKSGNPRPSRRPKGISKVISVCPFFGVNTRGSPRQDFLRTVAAHPHVMGTLAACVGAVPQSIRSGIISLFGGPKLQDHAVECTSLSMRYWSCYNACYLAKTEFKDLAEAPDWSIIGRLGERAAVIHCPNDMWAPDWQMVEMKSKLPNLKVVFEEGIEHGFCVTNDMSRITAEHLVSILDTTATTASAST